MVFSILSHLYFFSQQNILCILVYIFADTIRITFHQQYLNTFKITIMKKLIILFCILVGLFNLVQAQNAIVGTGFSTGWGSTCTVPTAANYTNFNASAGTTYTSGDLTPTGTGNQYWRLAVNWSSTYYQIGGGSDIQVSTGIKNSSVVSCAENGAWYTNVSSLSNRYVFKTLNAGIAPTGSWVFFELGGALATVNWVSQSPATPTVNDAVTITATMSGALPTGQGVYLRYSTDNFVNSTISSMTGSGTTYTASINAKTLSTAVKYYVFTSGSGLTIAPADADLYTINWNAGGINGGGNYLYTVAAAPAGTYIGKYLFDFGPTAGINGDNTTGADSNGNYWNNITAPDVGGAGIPITTTTFSGLKNSANLASSCVLTVTGAGFVSNGIRNGGLRSPYASQFMAAGSDPDLAIGTTTEDFWYTPSTATPAFKISGLNANKKYRFKIFGTRNGGVLRTAQYTIVGAATTVGTLNNSTLAGMGGTVYTPSVYPSDADNTYKLNSQIGYTTTNTYYGNNSSTYVTGLVFPNASGEFTLTLASNVSGQNAFINCMKLEEYKGAQTITFAATATIAVGAADYAPGASASSGLTVSYSSSNEAVATIVSGQIHIVGAGSTTITASQAGDGTYDPATNVTQLLTVSAGALTAQTITFGSLSAKNVGDASFDLTATAGSNLTVLYSSSNTAIATVSGITVTIVGAGTTDITASQAGNGSYAAAPNVIRTLTVNKLNQTITFGALSAKTDADLPYTISTPTSTSGLTVTLVSSNAAVALVYGSTITIVSAGTSTITASQAGNANYSAATSVPQTLTVSSVMSVKQNLFFDFGPNETTNGDVTVNPDVNSNYWNNITPSAGGTGVTAGTSYNSLINSSNTTTSYALTFTNSGFTTNGKLNGGLLSPYASQFGANSELAIATATEDYIYTGATSGGTVITFSGLNTSKKYKFKIFGCRNSNSDRAAQYTLQGAGAATVGAQQSSTALGLGGTVYIDAAASYPANLNVNYLLASAGSNTQAVTFYGNNSTVYTSGLVVPDVSGNITLTTITPTPLAAFAYINALKIEEYATAQTITFAALSAKNFGDADYSPGATASSSLAVTYSSSNTAVATIVSGHIHIVGNGTSTITASQAGDGTYSPATNVSHTLTVNNASSSITATGTTSFAYNHAAQGPASSTVSGSNGAVTYSYSGTGTTTYAASATKPTNVGTYQVVATVAAVINFNAASSNPLAFSITQVSTIVPVSIVSSPVGTYPLDQSVTWTFNLTGSAFTAGEDLYMWAWQPSEPDAGNWLNSSDFAKLTYVSGMTWSKTLTPSSYFSKTVSEIQSTGFWMLLKDKAGNIETATFSVLQTIKGNSTITVTGSTTFTYTGAAQGPSTANVTGSAGTVTYSYSGTSYGPTATAPTAVGTYTATATVAADANYNSAISSATAFTINEAANTVIVSTSNPTLASLGLNSASDVTITSSGSLTVDADKTVNSVTIAPGAKLDLGSTNTFTVKDLVIESGKLVTESPSISLTSAMIISSGGSVKLQKTLDASKWYFISFPCNVAISSIAQVSTTGAGTIGTIGSNWWIKYYDGEARVQNLGTATNWVAMSAGGTLTANKGYIIGLADALTGDHVLSFTLENTVVTTAESASTDKTIPVVTYGEGFVDNKNTLGNIVGENHKGWNLVGSPYLSKYDGSGVEANYLTFHNGTTYVQKGKNTLDGSSLSNRFINPFEAFFVQASTAGTGTELTFTTGGRQLAKSAVSVDLSDRVQLNFASATGVDNTNLIMDNNQSSAYQINQDLEKWITTDTSAPQVYTVLGGINYAFNALPMSSVSNLPVGIYTKTAGSTTISAIAKQAPSLSKLLLTDNGVSPATITDLLVSNYTFTATAGTNNSRFAITTQRITTDNNVIGNENGEAQISITPIAIGAKLIINNLANNTTVRVYDALGRMMINKNAIGNTLEIKLNARGVYTVHFQSGTIISTRKVIF